MTVSSATPLLNDMAIYVEVAKQRHFTRAAEALGMPVSTVSRRIRLLEEEIGTALLKRSTRSVDMTEAGALYYERCLDIVNQARLAHEQLLDMTQQVKGVLRISMPSSLSVIFMPSILTSFLKKYPELEFDLDLSVRPIDLLAENFDCMIRLGMQSNSNLVARRLGDLSLGLYASSSYLDKHGRPQHPNELLSHRCIVASHQAQDKQWTLTNRTTKEVLTVEVNGPLRINNALMMHKVAACHAGIVISSQIESLLEFHGIPLEPVLPDWTFEPYPIYALMPSRMLPLKTRVFLDYLQENLGQLLNGQILPIAPGHNGY